MCDIPNFDPYYEMCYQRTPNVDYYGYKEERELYNLIRYKYVKLLSKFIKDMYPGLRFDIKIRQRDPIKRSPAWYGHHYMELIICDVIWSPLPHQDHYRDYYETASYDHYINNVEFFEIINDFIPEINKHLLISYVLHHHTQLTDSNIPDYECWNEYYHRQYLKSYSSEYDLNPFT